jgi:hypothetical protein
MTLNNHHCIQYKNSLNIIRRHHGENPDHFITRCWFIVKSMDYNITLPNDKQFTLDDIMAISHLYVNQLKNQCKYYIKQPDHINFLRKQLSILK